MAQDVKNLNYDCLVYITKYIGNVSETESYDTESYYQISRGLKSVSATLSVDSIGNASVAIALPTEVKGIKNVDDNILLRRKLVTSKTPTASKAEVKKERVPSDLILLTVSGFAEYIALEKNDTFKYDEDEINKIEQSIIDKNPNITDASDSVLGGAEISIEVNSDHTVESVYVVDGSEGSSDDPTAPKPVDDNVNVFGEAITYLPILDPTKMQCFFKPMDKIYIYMSKRFQAEGAGGLRYEKVFEGLLDSSTVTYSGGFLNVSLSSSDILKWMNISYYNVNPAANNTTFVDITGGDLPITPFTTNLAGLDAGDIIKRLTIGEQNAQVFIKSAEYKKLWDSKDKNTQKNLHRRILQTNGELDTNIKDDPNVKDSESFIGSRSGTALAPGEKVVYVQEGKSVRGCGLIKLANKGQLDTKDGKKQVSEIEQGVDFNQENLFIDTNLKAFPPFNSMFKGSTALWNHEYKSRYEIAQNVANIIECEFFMDRDGVITFKPPYYNFNPGILYKQNADTSSGSSGTGTKKLTSDPEEDSNEPKVINGDQYLLLDSDIITYNITESDADIQTVMFMNGQVEYVGSTNIMIDNTTISFDTQLAKQFGIRMQSITMPFLGTTADETERKLYADAYLNRRNSRYRSGNISIMLRPELRLGRTIAVVGEMEKFILRGEDFNPVDEQDNSACTRIDVYSKIFGDRPVIETKDNQQFKPFGKDDLKKNLSNILVYYIKGITHNWAPKAQSTTALTLGYGRYWETTFGSLKYTVADPFITEIQDDIFLKEVNETVKIELDLAAQSVQSLNSDFGDIFGINSVIDITANLANERKLDKTQDSFKTKFIEMRNKVSKRDKVRSELREADLKGMIASTFGSLYIKSASVAKERVKPSDDEVVEEVLRKFPDESPKEIQLLTAEVSRGLPG